MALAKGEVEVHRYVQAAINEPVDFVSIILNNHSVFCIMEG